MGRGDDGRRDVCGVREIERVYPGVVRVEGLRAGSDEPSESAVLARSADSVPETRSTPGFLFVSLKSGRAKSNPRE